MGCSCGKGTTYDNSSRKNKLDSNFFNITVNIPYVNKNFTATFEIEKENILVYELVNNICFNSKVGDSLKANFTNRYNKEIDDFDYFIESLYGEGIENEEDPYKGKMWVPYINGNKEDWSEICRKNRVITAVDDVEFKYEEVLGDRNNFY